MTRSHIEAGVNYGGVVGSSADARLANLLGAAAIGITDRLQDAARDAAGLDGSDPTALIALLDFSPHGTIEALSQICGLTHSGAVRLVNRLVAAGHVSRDPGSNARSVAVTLTAAGRKVALRLRAARHEALAETMAGLTRSQRAELAKACETLIGALRADRLARRATGESPAGGALCRLCDFGACQRPQGNCPATGRRPGLNRPA
jgi:DNA-binding MarR family transcriptional regulator